VPIVPVDVVSAKKLYQDYNKFLSFSFLLVTVYSFFI